MSTATSSADSAEASQAFARTCCVSLHRGDEIGHPQDLNDCRVLPRAPGAKTDGQNHRDKDNLPQLS